MRLAQLIDVPVEENTGLSSRTEQWDGQTNPYIIRRAPFRIFEALKPVSNTINDSDTVMAFRLFFDIKTDVKAGSYSVPLTIDCNGEIKKVEIEVQVYNVVVQQSGENTLGYTNWYSFSNIARDHDVKMWSKEFWKMYEKYTQMMAYGRQNMFWITMKSWLAVTSSRCRMCFMFMKSILANIHGGRMAINW